MLPLTSRKIGDIFPPPPKKVFYTLILKKGNKKSALFLMINPCSNSHLFFYPINTWVDMSPRKICAGLVTEETIFDNFYNQDATKKLFISVFSWCKCFPSRPHTFFCYNQLFERSSKIDFTDFSNFRFFTSHIHSFIKYKKY